MPLKPDVQGLLQSRPSSFPGEALADEDVSRAYLLATRVARPRPVPESVAAVEDLTIPAGPPVRVYRPAAGSSVPTVIFFHGGGWVLGDLDMHDGTCRKLANRLGAVVVNVDYRLAPEHPFPAALEDAHAAVRWALASVGDLGGDASRIILVGASAGGNLVAAVAQSLAENADTAIALQVLIYPVIDTRMETPSHREFARGYMLEHDQMEWYLQQYVPDPELRSDPRVSPGQAVSLVGLPPAIIITAEFDPLRDEAERYADRLESDGVPVSLTRYDGQIHGFMNLFGVVADADIAIDALASEIRSTLDATIPRERTEPR